jgi:hypothetical protein
MDFDPKFVENQSDRFKRINTLSFCYEFKHDYDMVYFSHFAPFSYSDVFRYLCTLEADHRLRSILRVDHICNSLGKIPLYGLTITEGLDSKYVSQIDEIELFR